MRVWAGHVAASSTEPLSANYSSFFELVKRFRKSVDSAAAEVIWNPLRNELLWQRFR